MTATGRPRVLYVTGWCRSGSTVLGNLLGELAGVVHVGELHYLWRNGVLRQGTNTSCGCGEQVADCPLWSKVLAAVAAPDPGRVARRMLHVQRGYLRTRHTGARLRESAAHRTAPADGAPAVTAALDRMVGCYRAITAQTGARLVVDGSKFPAEAAALLRRDDVDLRILHLVRDPRASAHSWRRRKAYIPAMGVTRSTCYWTAANVASDRIGRAAPDRYLRLRYEDFTRDPRTALARVLELAGLPDPPPVTADGEAVLGVNHTVTGNPDRLTHGPVRIRPDDGWKTRLPAGAGLLATLIASPVLGRYGYSYRR
ncbi:sulfotransferase [Polymorphospora rubra]|uniref:Sulfotransferase family protein n=1 Tax=Polymorphospora rubra TaxID=338584 RepID=A0A810N8K1_9ACTN|nr:sulfotransferase [Polymorphospora rubra]BCJ68774.1 sulfotransferase family protein [Polymorphospora rubra]